MPEPTWQKSTYSSEASSCVNIATTPDGTIRLRESDEPQVALRTTRGPLKSLIAAAKGHRSHGEAGRARSAAQQALQRSQALADPLLIGDPHPGPPRRIPTVTDKGAPAASR